MFGQALWVSLHRALATASLSSDGRTGFSLRISEKCVVLWTKLVYKTQDWMQETLPYFSYCSLISFLISHPTPLTKSKNLQPHFPTPLHLSSREHRRVEWREVWFSLSSSAQAFSGSAITPSALTAGPHRRQLGYGPSWPQAHSVSAAPWAALTPCPHPCNPAVPHPWGPCLPRVPR